jgi:predicted phosphodiesterase
MKAKSPKKITARDLARKEIERTPTLSKTQIAKNLVEKYPLYFRNFESARTQVRTLTGTSGTKLRADKTSTTHVTIYKGFVPSMVDGDIDPYVPHIIKSINVGIIADVHLPYQSNKAIMSALTHLKEKEVDTLLLNGDIIDFYKCSRWLQNPTKKSLKDEINMLCAFIKDIKDYMPKVNIIYKLGNHEERWEHFIQRQAPQIWGITMFEFDNLLKVIYREIFNEELNIVFVKNKRIIKIGQLSVIHGHEFGESTFSPVNPARGYFLKAKTNVLGAHNHQESSHKESDMNGQSFGAWSIGFLCNLNPDYRPINKWNHGFARVEVTKGGKFRVFNHAVIDGEVL